jgi:hypothetical protein
MGRVEGLFLRRGRFARVGTHPQSP